MIAITTRFLGPTNTKGARIVAETANGHKLIRPFSHAHNAIAAHAIVACELARSLDYPPLSMTGGEVKNGYVFTFHGSEQWRVSDGAQW